LKCFNQAASWLSDRSLLERPGRPEPIDDSIVSSKFLYKRQPSGFKWDASGAGPSTDSYDSPLRVPLARAVTWVMKISTGIIPR
jgi:hypothetical protein